MRIPDALFPIINRLMKIVLRSPFHFFLSSNILLITFRGRKTGRKFSTPVRYTRDDRVVHLFSSPHANWWKNIVRGAEVSATIRRENLVCQGTVLATDDHTKLRLFGSYLKQFPGDAVYHGIKVRRNAPMPWDLLKSVLNDVVIVELALP